MDQLFQTLESFFPVDFPVDSYLKAAVIILMGFFIIGLIARILLGRLSVLSQSCASAIGILFIYAVTIVVYVSGVDLSFLVSPLPMITLSGDNLHFFSFQNSDYLVICDQLLKLVILSFLVNIVNDWFPVGKKLFSWIFFRCLSIILAMLLHAFLQFILWLWLPEGFLTWAPVILLCILMVSLAVGALKYLVGAVLTTVNPLIAVLYTFFFASVIGRRLFKAILTTALLSGIIMILNYFGCSVLYIGAAALNAYIPIILLLIVLWYFLEHKL